MYQKVQMMVVENPSFIRFHLSFVERFLFNFDNL
jgi:hypothetical protein